MLATWPQLGWGGQGCWRLCPLQHVPAPLALGTRGHGSPPLSPSGGTWDGAMSSACFWQQFFSLCGAQRPARCPQHGDPFPQHQAPCPSWSPRAAAAPSASPSSLRVARGSHSSHAYVAFPHRHRVHQRRGAGKGGQDAEPPERGVQTGSCHHSGEFPPQPGPRARQQPQLPAQLSWDMGFLLPPLTAWYPPTPPHSPPARKTCAPSATHTPSRPSSGPAPTNRASE